MVIKMVNLTEVNDLLDNLSNDTSISRSIRTVLIEIKENFQDEDDISIKIDSALQKVEDLSLDPNLNSYTRTQIWNLSSLLESAQER
ncbi:MAG: UPF0147 family protein [DPANN group archaeon]|nr:UPF0147 family protein [DPANN group archaeon]